MWPAGALHLVWSSRPAGGSGFALTLPGQKLLFCGESAATSISGGSKPFGGASISGGRTKNRWRTLIVLHSVSGPAESVLSAVTTLSLQPALRLGSDDDEAGEPTHTSEEAESSGPSSAE
jgi:hypothetical protein